MDAHELNVRTIAGDTIAVIAYCFKCYSLRAAREIGEMVIARYEERVYSCRPAVKYSRVNDASFSLCAVPVRLFHLPLVSRCRTCELPSRHRSHRRSCRCHLRRARKRSSQAQCEQAHHSSSRPPRSLGFRI